MPVGESYDRNLRATSMYSRRIFAELEKVADNMDFRHPRFMTKSKRNRSLGSAQAFIVELALTDERFVANLRKYMIRGGEDYLPMLDYVDAYH
ncbi:hypothetical protein [Paenibacillus whitsoniae]|uniref:Uncharacterized protein n=1 Tax=Paenibacillus whitsoniae TaxID=2496558 RepID=A0A430J7F0_9BACL|nr:hypothetical protein [Paenibacillus whitsoniae]RTE05474.1 hypothetical protein EJQ19_24940 [Paenibacillus whitsoniae]